MKVLDREIPWRQHCHRADDIATALRVADEFGYDLVLDHGTEAHLLADIIAERDDPGDLRAAAVLAFESRDGEPLAGERREARRGGRTCSPSPPTIRSSRSST